MLEGLDLPLLLDERAELEHAQLVRGDGPPLPRRRYRGGLGSLYRLRRHRRRHAAAVGGGGCRDNGRGHRGLVGRRQAEGALAEGLDAEKRR